MRKDFGSGTMLYPQPVAIIGTYNADGTPNAMNAAWAGIGDTNMIYICLGSHATTDNIHRTGEFTVSIADAAHVVEADYVGIVSGNKVPDKVAKAGLHAVKAGYVNAPIFEEFPIALECKFVEENDHGIYGQILNTSIDERVLGENGKVDPDKLQAISYDPMNHTYLLIGGKVGNAFSDGKKLI